jgi:hypothetical protein
MSTSSAEILDPPRKRSLSIDDDTDNQVEIKRIRNDNNLLSDLTDILTQIKSTPSSGEISAELLSSLRLLMLEIESLSADESNTEARLMKDESDKCLDLWFQDLVAQCEADGEDVLESLDEDIDSDNEEEDLALALALQDEEDYCKEIEKEEVCGKQQHEEDEDAEVDIV